MSALTFGSLIASPTRELEALVGRASSPDTRSLIGTEWRGYNQPWIARLLGIRKFIKGFMAGANGVEGYNVKVVQNGVGDPWIPISNPRGRQRYAFYVVREAGNDRSIGARYAQAALLDYGATAEGSGRGVERLIRDYLVQPDPANSDLLLGKAYFLVAGKLIPSSFFMLERIQA